MREKILIVTILIILGVMIYVDSLENTSLKTETEEQPASSQIVDTQVSIADKEDNVISMDSVEAVTEETETEEIASEEPPVEAPPVVEAPSKVDTPIQETVTEKVPIEGALTENNVYSFFQTPHAWWQGKAWSGEWGGWEYAGSSFGNFGCGMCCMANVYDTLSPYEVSPWDMFEYAQVASSYSPSSAGTAISWDQIKSTLTSCGFACELYCKPGSYEAFQQQIRESQSAVVLVSSVNDNTYWETTKGHYVTIWLYDEETDTVFLADSGKIARNRQRIPLRYVYNALKTASNYQYMTIDGYIEENNQWKANGITEKWIRP